MSNLRAARVPPLTGPLASYGRTAAAGLTLWATQSANLPPPWTGVELEVRDTAKDPAAAMRAVIETQPDVLFGPYGSSTMLAAARVANRVVWNHGGATSRPSRPAFPQVINVLLPASTHFDGVLHGVRATYPSGGSVSIFSPSPGFGREVATGASSHSA